jgi:hypothetical protein
MVDRAFVSRAIGARVSLTLALALLVTTNWITTPSLAQTGDRPDARTYAALDGIPLAEAIRRLDIQIEAGRLERDLTTTEATTFAGLWLQHSPTFRVVAAFTSDPDQTLKKHVVGTSLASIAEARIATFSLARLRADMLPLMWAAQSRSADLPSMSRGIELRFA